MGSEVFLCLSECNFFRAVTRLLYLVRFLALTFFPPSLKELPKYCKSEFFKYVKSKKEAYVEHFSKSHAFQMLTTLRGGKQGHRSLEHSFLQARMKT